MGDQIKIRVPAPRRTRRRQANAGSVPVVSINTQTNPSKAKRNNRSRRKKGKQSMGPIVGPSIRKCTHEYATAIVNPFGARSTMPCIPDTVVIPSHKIQTKCRGIFTTGTNGVGFVSLDPFMMVKNDGGNSGSQTSFPIVFTDPTYTGNNYDATVSGSAFLPGVVPANSNSPYNDTFMNQGLRQYRLVAAGLRITYTGSNFRNQGRVILARNQGGSAFSVSTASQLLQDNYSVVCPVSRKSEYVFYVPDDYGFLTYKPISEIDPNVQGQSHRSLLILVDGGDIDSPQSWLFEAVAYFELVGRNLTVSPSHGDPEGMATVLESLPTKNPQVPPKQVEASVLNRIYQKITENVTTYGPGLANMGMNYLLGQPLRRPSALPVSSFSVEEID